jgi:hypothetical protein
MGLVAAMMKKSTAGRAEAGFYEATAYDISRDKNRSRILDR